MFIKGTTWKYGDNVNTDVIYPGKYVYSQLSAAEMARHALEDLDANFAAAVQPGAVLVVGRNFGCGSSREQAVLCLKHAGVAALIGKSFARIFYRNCVNNGILTIQQPDAVDAVEAGQTVEIDTDAGEIRTPGGVFPFPPLPQFVLDIIHDGGLVEHTRRKLGLV